VRDQSFFSSAESARSAKRRPVQRDLFQEEDPALRYFAIASNRQESAEETVAWYNARGEHSENRIKELKGGFGMERMPCGELEANAVFFRIGALAYNSVSKSKREYSSLHFPHPRASRTPSPPRWRGGCRPAIAEESSPLYLKKGVGT
jgi:hypothetical protein